MEITEEQYKVLNRMIDKLTDIVVQMNLNLTTIEERVTKLEVSHFGQSYVRAVLRGKDE